MNLEIIDKYIEKAIFAIQKGDTYSILSQLYMNSLQDLDFSTAFQILRIIEFIPAQHYQQNVVNNLNKICDKLYRYFEMAKRTNKLLKVFKTICLNCFTSNNGFQQVHITFLKLVISNRFYKYALDILKYPMIRIPEFKSSHILQYLYYSGIIYTALRQYDDAIQAFTKILQLQKQETNMKVDAYKKLFLLNCLLGRHTVYQLHKADTNPYLNICGLANNDYQKFNFQSLPFKKMFLEDGNANLAKKMEYVSQLNKLQQFSSSHIRIPILNTQYLQYSKPETILILNQIRKLYKYDPKNNCIVFDKDKKNVEQQISKVVQLFLTIQKEDQLRKKKKQSVFKRIL